MTAFSLASNSSLWDVFLLFSIPVGGGIPAGVLLGQKQGLGWVTMMGLYLVSDIIMAIYFEPLLKLIIYLSDRFDFTRRFKAAFATSTQKTIAKFGAKPGPWTLVMIAFGVDPMTGRAAAYAAGHGFFAGWAIAIAGDMIFFTVIMASTIWLNGIFGNGTLTAVVILICMFGLPPLVQRFKK